MKEILSNIQCHTFFLIRKWSIDGPWFTSVFKDNCEPWYTLGVHGPRKRAFPQLKEHSSGMSILAQYQYWHSSTFGTCI